MIKYEFTTKSPEETVKIGEKIGKIAQPGVLITIEGELGAGKTTFTKGIAKGLGVKRTISSPTFTIIKEYNGRLPLYHMDVYRLEYSDEDIGFDEYFHGEGVTIVEWAQFIEEYLPEEKLHIEIRYGEKGSRVLEFTAYGKHYESMIDELFS